MPSHVFILVTTNTTHALGQPRYYSSEKKRKTENEKKANEKV